jgi:hypothetical protein
MVAPLGLTARATGILTTVVDREPMSLRALGALIGQYVKVLSRAEQTQLRKLLSRLHAAGPR